MSDPLGRHYCSEAKDLDDFGYAFCPILQKIIRCFGLDEDCKHRERKILLCICGGNAIVLSGIHQEDNGYRYRYYYLECVKCKKQGNKQRHHKIWAIESWNELVRRNK